MKRIYANYCMLEAVYVLDDSTENGMLEAIRKVYADRGVDLDDFDNGEWEETKWIN